jgi:hypothetical protein
MIPHSHRPLYLAAQIGDSTFAKLPYAGRVPADAGVSQILRR